MEKLIVGIDLGTTNSLVGVVESGFPIILADEEGRRILPSVVSYQSDQTLVGEPALRSRNLHPQSTLSSVKRIIGRRYRDLSADEISELPFAVSEGDNGELLIDCGDKIGKKTAEDVSAEILKCLKTTAESALECPVEHAVITVPAYFSHAQREATRRAAELAGWQVERILNEPTAAALAYGLNQSEDGQKIAVYDLGGGTFDLSVLQLNEGVFEVIATAGDTRLGGDDIDLAVANWISEKLELGELSAEQRNRVLAAARSAKEALSESEAFTIELPFFDSDSKSYELSLSRDQLEKIALPIIEKTRTICQRAFLEAKHKGCDEIDHLILVGGSTRLPLVRKKLEEWFKIEPNLTQHPDEAIAIGAAIQAGIMCGRVKQVVLLDVVPLSLGIETIGGLMNVIIPRNTTIPAKAGELFTNGVSNQESMIVRILQGEREMAKDNWLLGEITVPFEPGPKGSARVGVQFEIDENGILTVLTRDTKTNRDQLLKIENSAVNVDDEAVEQMISESVEHAFDDMNERILTEARMKSEELLPAVEAALAMAGEKIPEAERQEIEAAADEVRRLTEQEHPSLEQLKAANGKLDELTQNLAAILVEMAMDDALS